MAVVATYAVHRYDCVVGVAPHACVRRERVFVDSQWIKSGGKEREPVAHGMITCTSSLDCCQSVELHAHRRRSIAEKKSNTGKQKKGLGHTVWKCTKPFVCALTVVGSCGDSGGIAAEVKSTKKAATIKQAGGGIGRVSSLSVYHLI